MAVLGTMVAAFTPSLCPASHDDAGWSDRFGHPGFNGPVFAAVEFDGALIVGGRFTHGGGIPAGNLARWDGTSWTNLGGGVNGEVYALAVHDGALYVGGKFSAAGGVPASNIARWDGASWSALGSGANGGTVSRVYALVSQGSSLVAGGSFTQAGGVPSTSSIARWDGANWSALGDGRSSSVYALAIHQGDLIAGGPLGLAPGTTVARWNGSSWSGFGTLTRFNNMIEVPRVDALLSAGTELFAGGNFDKAAGSDTVKYVARWDGTQWVRMGAGLPYHVWELAWYRDSLVAGAGVSGQTSTADLGVAGAGVLARWDGAAWATVGGFGFGVEALCVRDTQLVVGGHQRGGGTLPAEFLDAWDGASWTSLEVWDPPMAGFQGTVHALAVHEGQLIAGGRLFRAADDSVWMDANCIARWTGSRWDSLGPGLSGTAVSLAEFGGDLVAGGWFTRAGAVTVNSVARWDGSTWSALGNGLPGGWVNALVEYGGELVAGGTFYVGPLARWNGTTWSQYAPFSDYAEIRSLAVYQGSLIVAGEFASAGGVPAANVARWDGVEWSALGAGLPPSWTLGVVDDTLYAAANGLQRWDGATWSPVTGTQLFVTALAGFRGDLVVAGNFTVADGAAGNGIMRRSGGTWRPLGSGVDRGPQGTWPDIDGLAVLGDTLFVGGSLTRAGTRPSLAIASWVDSVPPAAVPPAGGHGFHLATPSPNPSRYDARIGYALPVAARVHLAVFDLAGRRVALIEDRERPAGAHEVVWHGRGTHGRTVGAGMYFVRLAAGTETRIQRMVRIR